jgi:hypothetical protein
LESRGSKAITKARELTKMQSAGRGMDQKFNTLR